MHLLTTYTASVSPCVYTETSNETVKNKWNSSCTTPNTLLLNEFYCCFSNHLCFKRETFLGLRLCLHPDICRVGSTNCLAVALLPLCGRPGSVPHWALLRSVVLRWAILPARKQLAMSGNMFYCHNWYLVGRGKRCCYLSYKARYLSPHDTETRQSKWCGWEALAWSLG